MTTLTSVQPFLAHQTSALRPALSTLPVMPMARVGFGRQPQPAEPAAKINDAQLKLPPFNPLLNGLATVFNPLVLIYKFVIMGLFLKDNLKNTASHEIGHLLVASVLGRELSEITVIGTVIGNKRVGGFVKAKAGFFSSFSFDPSEHLMARLSKDCLWMLAGKQNETPDRSELFDLGPEYDFNHIRASLKALSQLPAFEAMLNPLDLEPLPKAKNLYQRWRVHRQIELTMQYPLVKELAALNRRFLDRIPQAMQTEMREALMQVGGIEGHDTLSNWIESTAEKHGLNWQQETVTFRTELKEMLQAYSRPGAACAAVA